MELDDEWNNFINSNDSSNDSCNNSLNDSVNKFHESTNILNNNK